MATAKKAASKTASAARAAPKKAVVRNAAAKKAAATKVRQVMHEFKEGELTSGSGRRVTSRKQAIAIALDEARDAGASVAPRKRARSAD